MEQCEKCLEENKESILTKGYGYGYIGKKGNCTRHDKRESCEKCVEETKRHLKQYGRGYGYIGEKDNCERHKKIILCEKCISDNMERPTSSYQIPIGEQGKCKIHDAKKPNLNSSLSWSDGQPYERSRRMKHQIEIENEEFSKKVEQTAYSSSLHHDENTWEILNQSLSGSGFKVSNKREELGDKLAHRDMVQQIGFNPFLGETNYVDDISIRDQFMKPINTTQGDKSI